MIGPMSSSLALAQRTASKARATMDDMSRQIATGQKVSSVKDDGAAWSRAAGLKSQRVVETTRDFTIARVEGGLGYTKAITDQTLGALNELRGLVLAARDHSAGSNQRQILQAQWTQAVAKVPSSTQVNPFGVDWSTHTINGSYVAPQDPMFGTSRYLLGFGDDLHSNWFNVTGFGMPVAIRPFDLATASAAQLNDVTTSLNYVRDQVALVWDRGVGADMSDLERVKRITGRNVDRLDSAISTLTDADMGKASTARANAETRQQLALSTISQAISAYGSYANGLLGNVSRTQRGVLA